MPVYEYTCPTHGRFMKLEGIHAPTITTCPVCSSDSRRVVSPVAPAVIKTVEQLPYGTGSRGRLLSAEETGGLPILIPSFGALEKEEIDYVAAGAIEREHERVKNSPPRASKVAIHNMVTEAKRAPEGKRKSTMDKIKTEGM